MKEYDQLVDHLINAPLSQKISGNSEKLAHILHYAKELFGGKISIPSIVIAGTKGKGSTCAVAESTLRYSGLKTGLFTSPHLVTSRERIKINGKSISEEEYVETYYKLDSILKSKKLTHQPFFALHALMAGLIFLDQKIDAAVIECGVGGRFDWTKMFDPTVCAVTRLEYDHIETLGHLPGSISWHKAGIFTDKSISLTIPQTPEFHEPLLLHAIHQGTKLKVISPVWYGKMGIRGPCAVENTALGAAAATELAKILGVKEVNALEGAANAEIGGRFHELKKNGIRWLFDGAHTHESIKFCSEWYDSVKKGSNNDVLICSTTKKRDPNILLHQLLDKKWKKIYYVSSYNESYDLNGSVRTKSLKDAINLAVSDKPNSILVTGSLHLTGDCLKELKWIPK